MAGFCDATNFNNDPFTNNVPQETVGGVTYTENDLFEAKILDHRFDKTKGGEPKLVFTCELTGKLADRWNVNSGVLPNREGVPPYKQIDAMVVLSADDEKLEKRLRLLSSLGFKDDDLEKLIPGSKKSHSFKGVTCYIKKDIANGYWNIQVPKTFTGSALTQEESRASLSSVMETAKRLKKTQKAAATAGVPF